MRFRVRPERLGLGLAPTVLVALMVLAGPAGAESHLVHRGGVCSSTSVGLIPLTDLGSGSYQGEEGGLYPGGSNTRPGAHESAGLDLARSLRPLDPQGQAAPTSGKIGLLSVGMSNTKGEFDTFISMASDDPDIGPHIVPVNGAEGSMDAVSWADPGSRAWRLLDSKLSAAGLTPMQVQVAWIKLAASGGPSSPQTFPERSLWLRDLLRTTVQTLKERFPNLEIAYLSSRIYAGYANLPLNPEPFAYQGGFAVKWLIEDQLAGDPGLNFNPAAGTVRAPWLAWGPYLWADGLGPDGQPGGQPGRSDGLEYACSDLGADGTHPSMIGRAKVAGMLMDFLKTDTTSRDWFGSSSTGGAGGACSNTSVGLVPLTDLGRGTYQGEEGGLYPGGSNTRPGAHESAGLYFARSLRPLDPQGQAAPTSGKIGLLSVGMSNTEGEFDTFISMASDDPDIKPHIVPVNGAEGSMDAVSWADPGSLAWSLLDSKLSAAGLTPMQVQVAWIKLAASAGPFSPQTFPERSLWLRDLLRTTVQTLKERFPNLEIAYLSSRIYAGYANLPLNPEPFAYQGGFAVKWLIEDQLAGDPGLNFNPAAGTVRAPWLAWGPYLWADGLGPDGQPGGQPGRSDGLEYACSDLGADGTHPSMIGRAKVAGMLMDFLKTDATSRDWFRSRATVFGDNFESGRLNQWQVTSGAPR